MAAALLGRSPEHNASPAVRDTKTIEKHIIIPDAGKAIHNGIHGPVAGSNLTSGYPKVDRKMSAPPSEADRAMHPRPL